MVVITGRKKLKCLEFDNGGMYARNYMEVIRTAPYKGYVGSVEYDTTDDIFYGKVIGIRDLVGYHTKDVGQIFSQFQKAVDDYLYFCIEVGKEPEKGWVYPYKQDMLITHDI